MARRIRGSGRLSRRSFGLAGTAGFFAAHGFGAARAEGPADKLSIAVVGIGGRGAANLGGVAKQNIVALCDCDDRRVGKAYEQFPQAERFTDFRRMFDTLEKRIDAVVISTPDHTHFHPAWWALERGKHLYLEKPLAHEVDEVRRLTEAALTKKLATQLGSQRHAMQGLRNGVEIVKSGKLGPIREVHCWINSKRGMPQPPAGPQPVPGGLDWDLWLGPVAERPYTAGFAPYDWRFWWEFGTGETGNWGCHVLDIPYWALELGHPVRVSGGGPEPDPQRTPTSLTSRLDYPERRSAGGGALPPVSLHWHQGKPAILGQLGIDQPLDGGKRPSDLCNTLFIGSEGKLFCGFEQHVLLPVEKFADFNPPRTLAPSPGFYKEWLDACRGGPPASCHFDYSGPMAEAVLLANIAFRVRGEFDWDAAGMKSGRDDVDQMLRREYRRGWEA